MRTRTILVVEDDAALRRGLVDALEFEGYRVLEAADGTTGIERALRDAWDLLLLDLVLPRQGGLEILRAVRRVLPTLPVIILTARGDEGDRVQGLRLGADDYVVKPFSVRELLARVEAVLRRSPERPQPVATLALPHGTVHLEHREVSFADGERVELTQREVELLGYLAREAGRVVSRDELLTRLWHVDPKRVETRTIDMTVARLREKLRDSPPALLLTVRGRGYRLARDARPAAGPGALEESAS